MVESLFSTVKQELGLNEHDGTRIQLQQLQGDLAFWVDGYYSRERRHSTMGYVSPINYEQQFINSRTVTFADS